MQKRKLRAVFVGDEDAFDEGQTAHEVHDDRPDDWVNTGLLDCLGKPIYRRRPTVKFRFVP